MLTVEEMISRTESATKFRLYSIQTLGAWQKLQRQGFLKGDGRRVENSYRSAYRWMIQQMDQRLVSYDGDFPVWAWYHPRPDLRQTAHLPSGTPGVLLEIEIPANRVLLSGFETWHFVLNGQYLALSEDSHNRWEEAWQDKPLADPEKAKSITQSWQQIFDLRAINQPDSEWLGPVDRIQAAFGQLRLDEICTVEEFVAR